MNGMMRIISNFKDFYNDINGATLTGAIDVIVVEQPDGSFNCSPFHVRFGKLGVLRSKQKVVDIEINGHPLNIHMKLGESGEAFFVEELEEDEEDPVPEHLATSPIPVSEIENIFRNGRRRSFSLDDIDLNEQNSYEKRRNTADNQLTNRTHLEIDFLKRQIGLGNIEGASVEDMTLSLTNGSKRSEEDDLSHSQNDISETIFKMDSLDEPLVKTEKTPEKETPPTMAKPSLEEPPSENKSSKKKRKKMRKKNAPRKSASNHLLVTPTVETLDKTNDSITDRSSLDSNCSEAELKDLGKVDAQETPTQETTATSGNLKKVEADFHFFSDTELTAGNGESRSTSPVNVESVLSDSELETRIRAMDEKSLPPSTRWDWGGFPSVSATNSPISETATKEEHRSMLSSMFSFMKSKHNAQNRYAEGGVYLSDITAGQLDQEVAELYFSQKKDKTDIDIDCESGNGPSLAQSPNSPEGCKSIDSDFEEHNKTSLNSMEVSLSLCGNQFETFDQHLISFPDFCNNPAGILDDPKLVVKMNEKFYMGKVAVPILISVLAYGRPLMQPTLDQLQSHFMPLSDAKDGGGQQKAQASSKSSWWHWRGRSSVSREDTPAKDVTDGAEKPGKEEEPMETVVAEEQREGEEAAEEVKKETDKPIEAPPRPEITVVEKQPEPDKVVPPDSPKGSDKFRKTLRLSSKQIGSLNLRDGMNEVEFSVTTAYQGTTRCKCHLYKWKWDDKIVISDIDGTITRSDVLGHILPIVGKDWAQSGVAQLFNKIKDNGYQLLYLSARAIGQARITREYLKSIKQGNMNMPDGPILLNPTSLITAFHREVIEKKPEAFKISCLSDIKALFPVDLEPFYAGYGNRINDVWSYRAVGIPIHRIFTINPKGELKHELTQTFQSSYTGQSLVVNEVFPPIFHKIRRHSEGFSSGSESEPEL
ncbi:phosphatidate phosphatase LPIN3 isoform X2 [Anthonomus grandis grandis]|uniref:phosphatidate phosphatase LPIN3 isoform X2 n=1 Tax=Anthonomus grandis grandis TaxID=2921223 RepID=UPI002165CEAF|nr:phosphatidate phosphatase LPIN3 isoform X2 [Anthonomus grandis grandis]